MVDEHSCGPVRRLPRHQSRLEASRRRALNTIQGSWKSTRSALYAWAEFCEAFSLKHFLVTTDNARMYSSFIQHGPTLRKYLHYLRLRWCHIFFGLDNPPRQTGNANSEGTECPLQIPGQRYFRPGLGCCCVWYAAKLLANWPLPNAFLTPPNGKISYHIDMT